MFDMSIISLMNVETPRDWLSDAPMRVKRAVKGGNSALVAGTKQPICAKMSKIPSYSVIFPSISHLTHVGAFPAHIRSRDYHHVFGGFVALEIVVVGNKLNPGLNLQQRMTRLLDVHV